MGTRGLNFDANAAFAGARRHGSLEFVMTAGLVAAHALNACGGEVAGAGTATPQGGAGGGGVGGTDTGVPIGSLGGSAAAGAQGYGGSSSTSCIYPQSLCGSRCVNQQTDPNNCGACGRTCPATVLCGGGQCVCDSGTLCGSGCVDLVTDRANCGICGHECAPAETCVGGSCLGGTGGTSSTGGAPSQGGSPATGGTAADCASLSESDCRGACRPEYGSPTFYGAQTVFAACVPAIGICLDSTACLYPVGHPERCLWFRAICILSADWTEDLSCATPGCPNSAAGGSGGSGGCAGALPLGCGDQLSHSTLIQGRPNQWSGYSCTQRLESGPEVLYAFRPNMSGQATVRLSNLVVDLDVFLLDGCDSWVCTAVGKSITFRAEAGQTYSLAVDGYDGASGSYAITADCVE